MVAALLTGLLLQAGAVPASAAVVDVSQCNDVDVIAAAGSGELQGRNRDDPGDLVGPTLYSFAQTLRSNLAR